MLLPLLILTTMSQTTFSNPVFAHNFPDPFILEHEGTFYAYATHNGPKGFQVLTSKDLVNWTRQDPVGKPSWSSDQMWAPEVYPHNGKWYIFYSALNHTTNKRDLAVSVGDGPLGPFHDLAVLVPGASENEGTSQDGAIDPTIYFEGDQPYLLYIREAQPRALKIVKLKPDFSAIEGEAKALIHADRPAERGILDAPTMIKRDGTYWLVFSGGWFQSWKKDACYRVWSAHSRSLMGPYVKSDKPIIESKAGETYSPGHQTIFELPSGEWWMAYHGWNAEGDPMYGHNKLGRTLRLDRLTWTKSGPKVTGPTITPQAMPKLTR